MAGKNFTLFMWKFQSSFCESLHLCFEQALEATGADTVSPTVYLIGLLSDGGSGHPLCIEPENGPIVPADFVDLHRGANELYDQDPEAKLKVSTAAAWIHERREQRRRERAYGRTIGEVLQAKLGLRFFVGSPTLVNGYFVFTAVGLPGWVLDNTPHLKSQLVTGFVQVTRSLVEGVIKEILRRSSRELREPYAGADLDLDIDPADVVKAAAENLLDSVAMLAGQTPSRLFDLMTGLARTRYERRVGMGSLLLGAADSDHIDQSIALRDPLRISETRGLRKLLETSTRDGGSLLTDGRSVYGLGHLRSDYPEESESIFRLLVSGDGTWELFHADVALARVADGAARVPRQQRLQDNRFFDLCRRVLGDCDIEALSHLADAARKAGHGAMLVISTQAEAEAERLRSHAFPVYPTNLADDFLTRVTEIDGAVLVDPLGNCHAIGVILDGTASSKGDRSRGARYNSAVRYLASREAPAVILVVSEDGMVDLLPDLAPRIRRADRNAMLEELRQAAEKDPVDGEQFYRAYRPIQENAFYFSREQINEINSLMDEHWARRMADRGPNAIRVVEPALEHDEEMSDEYLLDD